MEMDFVLSLVFGFSRCGGFVCWCRVGSSRGGISGSGLVRRFVLGILGDALVLDISDVTVLIGLVSDDLSAAVGQEDAVRASDDLTVAALRVTVVVVRRIILDGVRVTVRLRGLKNK